ncbi:MAG: hypothetical protein JXB08_01055 [Bacilli bacterium]|nr:hypothetical protein [Bacilli bacterium]MBN2877205.1 hypothetical protein [Bacilli bacterium]
MKQMIERYIYDVTRRLPEKQREEVKKELRANIDDMLSDNPTDQEIEEVLLSLGHPRKMANGYRGKERYLIGPEWMDDYLMVLKIAIIIMASIGFVVALIDSVLNPESSGLIGKIFEVFFKAIAGGIDSAFSAFAVVTLIFIAIEQGAKKGTWKFELRFLPELPKQGDKEISKTGTVFSLIFSMIFGVLFLYLFWSHTFTAFWFDENLQLTVSYPIFNYATTDALLPLLVVCFAITIAEDLYRLTVRRWNLKVYAFYGAAKIISAVATIVFLTSANLMNPEFLTEIATLVDGSVDVIENGIHVAFTVLAVLTGLGAVSDIASTYFKKVQSK